MCKNRPENSREFSGFLDTGVIQVNAAGLSEWNRPSGGMSQQRSELCEWCRMH